MTTKATVTLSCDVEITINDPDAIARATGPNGDTWRADFFGLRTERDVLKHLAFNCLANGCDTVKFLDGWADMPADAATMKIKYDSVEIENVVES